MFSFHVKGRKQPQWPSPQQSRPARARSTVTEPAHEYGSWQPTGPSQQWLLRPLQAVLSRPGPASDWSTTRSAPTGPEGGHDPATLSATTPGLKQACGHGGRDTEAGGGPTVLSVPATRSRTEASGRMRRGWGTSFVAWRGGKFRRSGWPWRRIGGGERRGR
jgi:hypothetical protein